MKKMHFKYNKEGDEITFEATMVSHPDSLDVDKAEFKAEIARELKILTETRAVKGQTAVYYSEEEPPKDWKK